MAFHYDLKSSFHFRIKVKLSNDAHQVVSKYCGRFSDAYVFSKLHNLTVLTIETNKCGLCVHQQLAELL